MRKYLLFALLLPVLITSAQTSITGGNCKAQYKYAVNDKIMTLLPATAINFYDRSEGKIKEWYWDFGDGNTSREQNPLFIFNHPIAAPNVKMSPYRTVSLTVLTTDDCKSFYSETINIVDGTTSPTVNEAPSCKARFKYYQTASDTIGGTASFQLTNLSEGESLKYLWQFDDGKTSTEKEPIVTFDLKQAERKVCLTVTGNNSCSDTFCDAVYIFNPDKPVVYPAECYTGFGYLVNLTIKTLAPALVLDFFSKATPEAVEWKWDFGDGMTSIEANPTHIFNLPLANNPLSDPNPIRKVTLTVKTKVGCIVSYGESINIYMTTTRTDKPVWNNNNYTMRYKSSFPIYMSSCAGYAMAQVYLKDSLIKADHYVWSTGAEGQEVKGLCPTQTYSVKAKTPDGSIVSGTFVFNSDGTVTEVPINWYITGARNNWQIQYDLTDKNYTVEWRLCDGTIVRSDSIPLNSINCGSNVSNLILKDASGVVIYTENISLKTLATYLDPEWSAPVVSVFPNPVRDVLNIQYSGTRLNEMQVEISDISGKRISIQKLYDVESGQNISLNVSSLKKGIYICKMISDRKVIGIEKLIK